MESDKYFWKLSNLYISNNCNCIKFSKLSDLSSVDNSLIIDTEENKNEDELPYILCDAVKNSTTYKSLLTLFGIHHYENIDAFEVTKLKLGSESANCDIADNLLKEMLSLNEDMKDSDNSELRQETDMIYFWRSSKLSVRSIAAKLGETTSHVNKVIKKYKANVRLLLHVHKVKANTLEL